MGCGCGINIHWYDAIVTRCVSQGIGALILLIVAIRSLWVVSIMQGESHVLNFSEVFHFLLCHLLSAIHVGWPSFMEQDTAVDVILEADFEVGNSAFCIGLPFGCIGEAFEGGNVRVNVAVLHF